MIIFTLLPKITPEPDPNYDPTPKGKEWLLIIVFVLGAIGIVTGVLLPSLTLFLISLIGTFILEIILILSFSKL